MPISHFPSNAGGESIIEKALEFWKAGRNREEIALRDLENMLSLSVFNNKNSRFKLNDSVGKDTHSKSRFIQIWLTSLSPGGLWHTSLIDKNLVDYFVPFLPLEYNHVVQCAMAEMRDRKVEPDLNVADQVAGSLVYFPKTERVYAVKGCKTIQSKLDYYT